MGFNDDLIVAIVLAGAGMLVFLFIFGLIVGAWVASSSRMDNVENNSDRPN